MASKLVGYSDWLRDLKQQIKAGQIKAVLSVNSQLIMLYWDLGRQITEKQETAKWGTGFIEQLSRDLRAEFPEMTGFSVTNLRYCRLFYKLYSPIWEQPVPELQGVENENIKIVSQPAQQLEPPNVPQLVRQIESLVRQLVSQIPEAADSAIRPQVAGELQYIENQGDTFGALVARESSVPYECKPNGQLVRQLETLIVNQLAPHLKDSSPEICQQLAKKTQPVGFEQDIIPPQVGGELEMAKITLIPWGHHKTIIDKIKDVKEALFYVNKTIENHWSRAVLEYQIETNLYERQGKAVTNFSLTLPAPQSDLANELLKDPYNFEFLSLSEKVKETDLEKALVRHVSHFLTELGIGFAYMGRQFALKVGKKDYRTDLLFYHTRLKCYVVIELKAKEFEPEFVGKLNFYITAVNELVKDGGDKPTIGMLLCKNKDNYEVEFSLKDINNPIGVSTFRYTELTDEMKAALPSAEELQNELLNFEREHGRELE